MASPTLNTAGTSRDSFHDSGRGSPETTRLARHSPKPVAWNPLNSGLSFSNRADMTNPTAPVAAPDRYSASPLPQDTFRTLIALAIVALTIGGWIYVLAIPVDRFALSAQTKLWWIEQIVGFVLAIICIGIAMRKRAFLTPAFWLTIYSLVFDVMRWIFEFREGQLRIPIAMVLYALFIWRLHLTRRAAATEARTVAV